MNARRFVSLILGVVLGASTPFVDANANAGTLKLRDGSVVTVETARQLFLPIGRGPQAVGTFGGGMRYSVVEPNGNVWAGTVPGTPGAAFGHASVGQNPVSGDVLAVFSQHVPGGSVIAFTSWTGQSFAEARALGSADGEDLDPVLAFGEAGDAILSWQHEELFTNLYVRHFDLAPSGVVLSYSFSDLGQPEALLRPAGGPVGLRPGVSHAVTDSVHRHGYVFLASEARDKMGLVRLNLEALKEGGGFNAPPVPVSLSVAIPQSVGAPGQIDGRAGEKGVLLEPWRLVV